MTEQELKQKIRSEIERMKEVHESNLDKPMERGRVGHTHGYLDCCDELLSFIDSLPEEKPTVDAPYEIRFDPAKGFDMGSVNVYRDGNLIAQEVDVEAVMQELDEKIKLTKEHGSWKGVDVDKFMDDVRGREPKDETLEEAAMLYASPMGRKDPEHIDEYPYSRADKVAFKAGAEWLKEKVEWYEGTPLATPYQNVIDKLNSL